MCQSVTVILVEDLPMAGPGEAWSSMPMWTPTAEDMIRTHSAI